MTKPDFEFDEQSINDYLATYMDVSGQTPSYEEIARYQHGIDNAKHEDVKKYLLDGYETMLNEMKKEIAMLKEVNKELITALEIYEMVDDTFPEYGKVARTVLAKVKEKLK